MSGTALPISELVRDEEFVLRADRHELESFGPTFDNAIEGEGDRLASFVGAIEDGAVDECTFIVNL